MIRCLTAYRPVFKSGKWAKELSGSDELSKDAEVFARIRRPGGPKAREEARKAVPFGFEAEHGRWIKGYPDGRWFLCAKSCGIL